jgi:hypothetical protein
MDARLKVLEAKKSLYVCEISKNQEDMNRIRDRSRDRN